RTPTGQGQRPNTGQRKGPTTQNGPTPTTLSGAASETYNGEPPRKSRAPLFAAIGGVVAIGAVIGVVSMGKKSDPTAGSLPPAAVQKDEFVTVTVKSDPPGAKVTRGDNDQSGVTPWEMKVKRGESFDVLVKMEGFASKTHSISADKSYAVLVPLEKVAAAATPPVQPVVNTTTPPTATTAVDATAAKDKHHHHSSSSSASKDKGDSAPDKSASKDKPAGKDKPAKGGKDEGDDMKLLQPKF
ncbi:MAG: PEGA domain-containing protein, partial [Polyangia bacterium]